VNEPTITINGRELSREQSRAVRVAVLALIYSMREPKTRAGLGQMGISNLLRLDEVMAMIDATKG
jgi:hypothetical protein